MSSSVQFGGRRRGKLEYFLTVAVLVTLLGTLWLGWKYDTLENLKNYLQQQQQDSDLELGSEDWAASLANITILESAVSIGAVCLDGSPPAYYWSRGSGTGVNNWLVFLEGGGWCSTDKECFQRSLTSIGSSKYMSLLAPMDGVLSSSPSVNPDFYNWNRVLVKYCDGGSFNGYVGEPKQVPLMRNGRDSKDGEVVGNIFFRGQRIWQAVIEDLLNRGMNRAHKALLGGCSAGGLASILHCDQFQDLMPKSASVKCFSDAGFFLHVRDVTGAAFIEEFYKRVVLMQNMSHLLPEACTSQRTFTQCFFPQYLISSIKTPFFMLNPAYDTWQFGNVLIPPASDPLGSWQACRNSLSSCSESQLVAVQGFRDDLLKALRPLLDNEKDGAFIDSCYSHCQGQDDHNWNSVGGPKVDNKSPAQALADWYFGQNGTKIIDCPFPCNPTCGAASYV